MARLAPVFRCFLRQPGFISIGRGGPLAVFLQKRQGKRLKKPQENRPVKRALDVGENGVALHFLGLASMRAQKNKVCVLSPGSFSDNSKYIYSYLHANLQQIDPDLELFWLCHSAEENEQLRAAGVNSFQFGRRSALLKMLIETKYVFACTHHLANPTYCYLQIALSGATKIQLWHGVPAKSIAYQLAEGQPPGGFAFYSYDCLSADYVTSESDFVSPRYQEGFPNAEVIVTGSPRTDILFDGGEEIEFAEINTNQNIIGRMRRARAQGAKTVLYCPTFRAKRQDRTVFLNEARAFIESCAGMRDCLLVIKNHKVSEDTPELRAMVDALDTDRVLFVDPRDDIYPYLRETGILVTDYSSTYYDFLLTGGRVLFFQPDREAYLETREIYDERDVSGYEVGEYATRGKDCAALLNTREDQRYVDDRAKLKQRIFKYDTLSASKRVVDRVLSK